MSFRSAIAFAAISLFLMFVGLSFLEGCKGAKSPERAIARGTVETTSAAAVALDEACARVALAYEDIEMAGQCAKAYDAARISLIAVANGIDAWDRFEQTRSSVRCAVDAALSELAIIVTLIRGHNAHVPPIFDDARALSAQIGPCHGS